MIIRVIKVKSVVHLTDDSRVYVTGQSSMNRAYNYIMEYIWQKKAICFGFLSQNKIYLSMNKLDNISRIKGFHKNKLEY